MAIQVYPSDLTDAEWALLAGLLPPATPGGRPRPVDLRRVVNGLFYLVRPAVPGAISRATMARGPRSITIFGSFVATGRGNGCRRNYASWCGDE
jgi:hypothetical protein